ncbi:Pectinesterase QRT1-like protein [Drosera capensis]
MQSGIKIQWCREIDNPHYKGFGAVQVGLMMEVVLQASEALVLLTPAKFHQVHTVNMVFKRWRTPLSFCRAKSVSLAIDPYGAERCVLNSDWDLKGRFMGWRYLITHQIPSTALFVSSISKHTQIANSSNRRVEMVSGPSRLCFRWWLLVLLVILSGEIQVCCARHWRRGFGPFITWDDLFVYEAEYSASRFEDETRVGTTPVIVVDQDGNGDSVTVQGAVDLVPDGNSRRVKILILPGIYREKVNVPRNKPYISFIGKRNHSYSTVISWNNKASDLDPYGRELGTYGSATVTIFSDYFCASEITIENTVVVVPGGYGMQAVALRVTADKAMFYKVNVLGEQDTLSDDMGTHFFYQCLIQGSVDFIFGNARSLYQDSVLHSIANRTGAIAAHHRNSLKENSGFSFLNCTITGSGSIYLGRAWGPYSTVVYSLCNMEDIITPVGWSDWNHPSTQRTAQFGEFQNIGRGADTRRRVSWARRFSYEEVKPYLDMRFINGDKWLRL